MTELSFKQLGYYTVTASIFGSSWFLPEQIASRFDSVATRTVFRNLQKLYQLGLLKRKEVDGGDFAYAHAPDDNADITSERDRAHALSTLFNKNKKQSSSSRSGHARAMKEFAMSENITEKISYLLEKFNFDSDFGTASRLVIRLEASQLNEPEYMDYLSQQLWELSEDVKEGQRSRRQAQRLIGSTKSIQWYKQAKQEAKPEGGDNIPSTPKSEQNAESETDWEGVFEDLS